MRPVAEGVAFGGVIRVLAVLLAAYLLVGQAVVSGWSQRRFRRALARDPRARLLRYRRTVLLEWSGVAACLLLVAAAGGLDLADLGLRWPRLAGGAAPYTVVGGLGLVLSVGLLGLLRRRVEQGVEVVAPGEVAALLPRTVRERRAFAAVALTAGICEETLYRGMLLALAGALRPEPGPARLVLVSALAFGLAHHYQGRVGVVVTAVLGACLTVLYLGSGSLLLPVLYHVLVDLRVLVLAADRPQHHRRGRRQTPPRPAPHREGPPWQGPPAQAPPWQGPHRDAPPGQGPPWHGPPGPGPHRDAPPSHGPPGQAPHRDAPPWQGPYRQAGDGPDGRGAGWSPDVQHPGNPRGD